MKYEAPYGVSDPNASYINGNPSTGTMGSIPPAASIENPQREIVNFETDSGLVPTDADLHQLSKSVQNGLVNYALDQGTPNFIAITPMPPISSYALGQHFQIKVGNPNTGPCELNANALGWAPLVHGDKTQLGAGEIFQGQIIEVAWDGANWQMLTGTVSGALIMMTAPRTLYVDAGIGDDVNYDGTQPTVDAPNKHGPFRTLGHALQTMTRYNLSGFTFNIVMADGIYITSSITSCPVPNGSGSINIQSSSGNAQACKLYNTGTGTCIAVGGGNYFFNGIGFQATNASSADGAQSVWSTGAGSTWLYNSAFFGSPGPHITCGPGGSVSVVGPITILGGGQSHITVMQNGTCNFWPSPYPTLNIFALVNFSTAFIVSETGGQVNPIYSAINGFTSVSGYKYLAIGNGVIDSGGRGINFLPGTIAGVTSTGGQYV